LRMGVLFGTLGVNYPAEEVGHLNDLVIS